MFKEYHRFGKGGSALTGYSTCKHSAEEAKEMVKEKNPSMEYYGTFKEYYPIQFGRNYLLAIKKETGCPNSEFILKTNKERWMNDIFRNGVSYHGSELNNNSSIGFTKQDLLDLADSMNDTDKLIVFCV